jgi:hypothetical protein
MRRSGTTILLLVTIGVASGCTHGLTDLCDDSGEPFTRPISVVIRDQSGSAAALGSVVTFIADAKQTRDSTFTDSLTVSGGYYGVHYQLAVTKPFYTPDTIENAYVPITLGGRCNYITSAGPPVTLQATLTLVPNAPLVRTLLFVPPLPANYRLDRGGLDSVRITPLLDANSTVSHAITWELSGDTASLGFNPATGVASFRCRQYSGSVTVVAKAVADTTVTDTATLIIQGHPQGKNDPPCS